MFHFFKYLIIALFLFAVLNLFRSNMDTVVAFKFQIPLAGDWVWPPVSVNYLLLSAFCAGVLFAAAIGAFRFGAIREGKKEIKRLKRELEDTAMRNPPNPPLPKGGGSESPPFEKGGPGGI